MEYQSAKEASEKYKCNIRTIQKWAKEGKIQGAIKVGRDWLIPKDAICSSKLVLEIDSDSKIETHNTRIEYTAMPLLAGRFIPGMAKAYIAELAMEEEQILAKAEYCYFQGESNQANRLTAQLRFSKNYHIRMSALLVHAFSNIQLQRITIVNQDFQMIRQEGSSSREGVTESEHLFGHLVAVMSKVLLHDTRELESPFEQKLELLSDGLRFFGTYVMAHYYYLRHEYHHSLGIAETALTLFGSAYPIGSCYLFLVVAMNFMSLHQEEKAERYFQSAWKIAKPDGFIEPFAEHHGLLGGLVEKCLKETEPESYKAIIQMVYAFSEGWRQIHNPATAETVTSDLTTMEFSVAMLASKGWSNKEIAKQLEISENTVKNMMKAIYQKLKITGRKELEGYLLK